jgi:hypothetical protein
MQGFPVFINFSQTTVPQQSNSFKSNYTAMTLDNQLKQSPNSKYEETFDCVLKCLKIRRARERAEIINKLKQEGGFQNQLKAYLFGMPMQSTLVFSFIYFICVAIIAFLVVQVAIQFSGKTEIFIRLFGILIIFILSVFLGVKFLKMTPKSHIGYQERWEDTLSLYLHKSGIKESYSTSCRAREYYQEARRELKITIGHYLRRGELLKRILLILGGIFIGCLPDKNFQVALITYSIQIFNVNPFGAACLCIAPPIFFYYNEKYYLPSAWMQQIIDQIDLMEK